jgi:hypothetical protein
MTIFIHFYIFITYTTKTLNDALFSVFVYSGQKCCPSLLGTTGIRVLHRNFRISSLFTVTCNQSPSDRCVSAAKMSISSGNRLLLSNKFCANPWHFYISLSKFYWGLGLLLLYYFILLFLLYFFYFLCLVFCFCVFVLFLCLCAGYIRGTCAVKRVF